METTSRAKAFFINGGAGRVICSIPAFEKYQEDHPDSDFIIVCEGGSEIFKGHPKLDDRVYDAWHRNLFKDKLKDMDIVSLEPYRIWEYYNQKCSLSQAFDIEINGKGIRELPPPLLNLSKDELLAGRSIIGEVKKKLKKEKVLVFQPFGRGIEYIDETLVDRTARSFELKDVKSIIKKLQKDFAVVLMSEFKVDFTDANLKEEVAMPEGLGLRQWAGLINYCDHFLGCDSVGQHIAYSLAKETTVVIGSTFPINVSYPDAKTINILDLGELDREYSPIRITQDERVDRKMENIMSMTPQIVDHVIDVVSKKTSEEKK